MHLCNRRKVKVTFDNNFYGVERLETQAATYAQHWVPNGDGTGEGVILTPRKRTNITDTYTLGNSYNLRSNAFVGQISYNRTFEMLHRVSADLNYFTFKAEATGSNQDVKTANTSLRLNYTYADRYVAEFDLARMASGKFKGNNRFMTAYAGGLAWILSEEDFLKGAAGIDYLKLKASAGLLGYDIATPWFSYDNRWSDNGTARISQAINPVRVTFDQVGNPDLKWEKSAEVNIGVEGLFLGRRLWVEANFFDETRSDIIQRVDALYTASYGGLYPYVNWGKVNNRGFEAEVHWSDNIGAFFYRAGANLIWSRNKVVVANQITYADEYRRQTGRPSDAIFGYVSQGLFGRDVDLNGHVHQTLGNYAAGDIAYQDLNGDNRIDDLDRRMIGNSFPRTQFGIDINLFYKGFGLYVLGTAQLGVHTMLNNTYYWNYGEGKYSILAAERYHAQNNPDGSFPRLTTTQGTNNFTGSDFWLEDTGFFRLKNVELSYTFGYDKPLPVVRKIKIYLRGTNLFTLSKLKDLDPEAINAGVTNYPVLKMVTGGLALTF